MAAVQVCIDLFAMSSSYVDVATLSRLCHPTAGQLYHYSPWVPDIDASRVSNDLRWNLYRPQVRPEQGPSSTCTCPAQAMTLNTWVPHCPSLCGCDGCHLHLTLAWPGHLISAGSEWSTCSGCNFTSQAAGWYCCTPARTKPCCMPAPVWCRAPGGA